MRTPSLSKRKSVIIRAINQFEQATRDDALSGGGDPVEMVPKAIAFSNARAKLIRIIFETENLPIRSMAEELLQ